MTETEMTEPTEQPTLRETIPGAIGGNAFLTLVVHDAVAPLARTIAATLDTGGVGMWRTGLSASGQEPATHYVSSGFVGDGWLTMVPVATWEQDAEGAWVETSRTDGNAAGIVAGCAAAGVTVTLTEVEGMFAAADVTQQDWSTVLTRLGLQMVQPAEPTDAPDA